MRDKAIEEGNLPKSDHRLQGSLKDIVPATIKLLKNPTYMFNTMATTAASFFGAGLGAFISKFAELKFNPNPGLAGVTLGVVFLFCYPFVCLSRALGVLGEPCLQGHRIHCLLC